MCQKCGKSKCVCKVIISRKGITGKTGAPGKGPPGPPGPPVVLTKIVGQSAQYGAITGAVGTTGVGTLFTSLENNFFNAIAYFYVFSLGLTITAAAQHTVKLRFKKNGVFFGPQYERTLFPKDYITFSTDLNQFVNGDFLDLYIESTALDCQVQPGHLIHYRQ